MMRESKKWRAGLTLCAGFCLLCLMTVTSAASQEEKPFWKEAEVRNVSIPTTGLPDIAGLAEKLMPTVVNIQVSKTLHMGGGLPRPFGDRPGERDPFRDFFEKFFGDRMPKDFEQKSMGSGVIISKDGYVLSNNHVVGEADEILVKLTDKEEFEGKVVGRDPATDLALVKIDPSNDLPTAVLGDSGSIRVGEWVIAIGNPFGLEHTVTTGIISATGRVIGSGPYDDFIQTDASINPGNSGGPLFNLAGEVIGINTAIVASGQGIGFAIPINMAKDILPQLKDKGKVTRGWLGVQIQPWEPGLAEKFGMDKERGALVGRVMEGEPADKAGVKNGDVILKIDDKPIEDSRDLLNTVARLKPGQEVKILVWRGGEEKALQLTLGERPSDMEVASEPSEQEDRLGLTVQEVTPELAEQLGLDQPEGVIVSDVKPGSPADKAGLQRGDIIHEMERQGVKDLSDYKRILTESADKRNLLLWIQRGQGRIYVVIRLKD